MIIWQNTLTIHLRNDFGKGCPRAFQDPKALWSRELCMKASCLGNLTESKLSGIIFPLSADYNDCRFIFTALALTWCRIYINTGETRSPNNTQGCEKFISTLVL